jgi:hypothetical protein
MMWPRIMMRQLENEQDHHEPESKHNLNLLH